MDLVDLKPSGQLEYLQNLGDSAIVLVYIRPRS